MRRLKGSLKAQLQFVGWLLFLAAGILFVGAGVEAGSLWGTGGGVLWVLGVLLFLAAFLKAA